MIQTKRIDILRKQFIDNCNKIQEDRRNSAVALCKFIQELTKYLGVETEFCSLQIGNLKKTTYDSLYVEKFMKDRGLLEGWTLKINIHIFPDGMNLEHSSVNCEIPIPLTIIKSYQGYVFTVKHKCFETLDDFYDDMIDNFYGDICEYIYSTILSHLKINTRSYIEAEKLFDQS